MEIEDKREFRRYSYQSACEIKISSDIYNGFVVDYSEGLGVILKKAPLLKEGEITDISIPNMTTRMKGRVAWVSDLDKDVRVGFRRVGNLNGRIKAFQLADVFIGILRGTKTGILEITSGEVVKQVYIKNGDMIFADSSLKDDRLGEMLVIEGKITPEQFDEASVRLIKTNEKLGKVLVDMSCITPGELYQAVKRQVKGIILGLFAIEDGTFEFKEGPLPTDELITLIISAVTIIYCGMKRVRNIKYIERMCPSPAAVLDLSQDPMEIFQSITLESADKKILYLINGNSSLETIVSLSPSTRFETLKTISALLRIGIISIKEEGDTPAILSEPEQRLQYDEALITNAPGPVSRHDLLQTSNEIVDTGTEAPLQNPGEDQEADAADNRPVSSATIADSHYELGAAYMDMGLMENAINEFRFASKDASIRVKCCKVIAECYLSAGRREHAVEELIKLLSELYDDNESYMDVKYTLADIYMQNKEYNNALKVYKEVLQQDATYRDVSEKIKSVTDLLSYGNV